MTDAIDRGDWTRGGDQLVYQQCSACAHAWYFDRGFCPQCASDSPVARRASGWGRVHASTLVHRAPDDEFRAAAPYRIVLVDLDEGVRVMGHADPALGIGDRVRFGMRQIAGRALPFFTRQPDQSHDS